MDFVLIRPAYPLENMSEADLCAPLRLFVDMLDIPGLYSITVGMLHIFF